MAIRRRRHKHGREGRKQHTDELSAMLAPLEELKPEAAAPQQTEAPPAATNGNGDGEYHDATIRVDSRSVKMPDRLLDEDEPREGLRIFRVEPLVLVIVGLMLVFMVFIAWRISLMPDQ